MPGPWDQYQSAAPAQAEEGPWTQFTPAAPTKSFTEKLGETWPARLAKGIYSGVTLPGDVYQGNTQVDPSNPEFMGRVMDLASVASPMAPRAATSIESASAIPSTDALFSAANAGYKEARNSPLTLDSAAIKDWAKSTQSGLSEKGILPEFAPDTHAVLNQLQTAEPGAVATGGNIISAREALRQASQNYTNPREKLAANEAIAHLDRFIKEPPPQSVMAGYPAAFAATAEGARGNYAAASRASTVQDELEIARRNAAAANSGRNVDNAERQRFNAISKSDKKSAGFNDAELAQMDRIIFGTPTGNALRTGGNMLGGGGGLAAPIVAGIGASFNPLLAAAPVAGWAMKKGADALTSRNINKLDEMVRSRSPLAEQLMAGPQTMSPAEQSRQTLLIRALMAQGGQQQ